METVEVKVYQFDELSESAKQKAIQEFADINVDYDWWSNDDALMGLSAKEMKDRRIKDAPDSLITYKTMYFDIDRRYWHLEFVNPVVTDNETMRKFLRIPKRLWDKVYLYFPRVEQRDGNTTIDFEENDSDRPTTKKEQEILDRAKEIFSDKVDEALNMLESEYDYLTGEEAIADTIRANEYTFTEDGERFRY